jgi:hypothetical protein
MVINSRELLPFIVVGRGVESLRDTTRNRGQGLYVREKDNA